MKTLLYSNVFIALAGAMLCMGSFRLLGQTPNLVIGIWVFFSILAVYTAQRLMKLRVYDLGADQMVWVVKHKRALAWITGISLFASLILGLNMSYEVLRSLWPMVLISLLYAYPFIPKGREHIALRELPLLKVFLIATVWTWISMLLPMRASGVIIGAQEKIWLMERFCFIWAITIPFDIRDLGHDKVSMRTIPQVIGLKAAGLTSLLLVFLAASAPVLSFYNGTISTGQLLAALITYCLTLLVLCFGFKRRPYWYYLGVLDGMMLSMGFLLLFE